MGKSCKKCATKLLRLQSKFRKIPLLVIYYMTKLDDVRYSSFWVILKITSGNLHKAIHHIINYSTLICPFESRKCGKGENNKNLNISRLKRAF